MLFYLTIFITGGLVGWGIDTAYRSACDRCFAPNTWLKYFSIIYAVAAVLLYVLFAFLPAPIFVHIVLGLIIAISLELFSGIIALSLLKKRLWDYSANRFNYLGIIDLEHSFYWLILVACYRVIYYLFI